MSASSLRPVEDSDIALAGAASNAAKPHHEMVLSTYANSTPKRVFDIIVSVALIAALFPLLLLVAILIRLETPGSVLFTQQRTGRNGKQFKILKFRSMHKEACEEQYVQAKRNDARVTRVGSLIRRTSIDELPQLLNVVFGEMSLVGPRPHPAALDEKYADVISGYNGRYSVTPGITGLAQVRGARGETATNSDMRKRIECDLEYVQKASFVVDLGIMLSTSREVVMSTEAC